MGREGRPYLELRGFCRFLGDSSSSLLAPPAHLSMWSVFWAQSRNASYHNYTRHHDLSGVNHSITGLLRRLPTAYISWWLHSFSLAPISLQTVDLYTVDLYIFPLRVHVQNRNLDIHPQIVIPCWFSSHSGSVQTPCARPDCPFSLSRSGRESVLSSAFRIRPGSDHVSTTAILVQATFVTWSLI